MNERQILFVGESHTMAIASAVAARGGAGRSFAVLDIRPFRPLVRSGKNGPEFGADLIGAIDAAAAPDTMVVSCIGGNRHNILSLVAQPEHFDFRLSEHPELPVDETAWIIPEAEIQAVLEARLEKEIQAILLLRRHLNRDICHQEAPPPLADEKKIIDYAERAFVVTGLHVRGVSPRLLRRKMWLLQNQILRRWCGRNGILFQSLPPHVFDEAGLMHPSGYGRDATHGNAWFGEQILRELERIGV